MENGFRKLSRGHGNEVNAVRLYNPTLPLKMANRKEGFILKECDIHGHEILSKGRMITLVALLVQRIPHKNTTKHEEQT